MAQPTTLLIIDNTIVIVIKPIIKWLTAMAVCMLAVACSNDDKDESQQEMSLSTGSVKVCLQGEAATVGISGGSGNFNVAVNGDAAIATCNSRIVTVTPAALGDARMTVTDTGTGATAYCDISVGRPYMEFRASHTADPFFSNQNLLYMECFKLSPPCKWVITKMDGQTLHEGTFTTAYMRDETVSAEGEDYKFALFSLEMKEGNTTHHYIAADTRTVLDGTPFWAILFPGSGWSKPVTTALSRTAGPISFSGIMFFDSDADLLNPSVTWTVTGPVPLP